MLHEVKACPDVNVDGGGQPGWHLSGAELGTEGRELLILYWHGFHDERMDLDLIMDPAAQHLLPHLWQWATALIWILTT